MFGIHNYTGFIAAILLFQLAPGPGTVAILQATAHGGRRGGLGAVFGTLACDFVYMVAAVSGVAAFLAATPALFSILQWGGIAYLCRLGSKLLFSSVHSGDHCRDHSGIGHSLRQAFRVGLTNPKAIIFFMAFFPLFMTTATKPATLILMMVHISGICLLYQVCLVLIGHSVIRLFRGVPQLRLVMTRLSGVALIAFGAKLAADR